MSSVRHLYVGSTLSQKGVELWVSCCTFLAVSEAEARGLMAMHVEEKCPSSAGWRVAHAQMGRVEDSLVSAAATDLRPSGPHAELWGLLCPDCGPDDREAIAAAALAEVRRARGIG